MIVILGTMLVSGCAALTPAVITAIGGAITAGFEVIQILEQQKEERETTTAPVVVEQK